jgi:hypothetical protein
MQSPGLAEPEAAAQKGMMGTVLPSRYQGVWLAGGRLPISASPPIERLLEGVERVASIRAEIGSAAKVATMPPVEIVPYIWTRNRALICGRVTALRRGDGSFFGVQLPAPTALCTDRTAVRALLVHEFAHWFYPRDASGKRFRSRRESRRHFGPPERRAHRVGHADRRSGLVRRGGCTQLHPARGFGDARHIQASVRSGNALLCGWPPLGRRRWQHRYQRRRPGSHSTPEGPADALSGELAP